MVHKYFFFIQNGEIRSYKWKDGRLLLVKYKGEDFCSIEEPTFWEWWEESNSYIPLEDKVDFCFVGDEIEDFYSVHYSCAEASEWSMDKIEAFLNEYLKESRIELTNVNKGNRIQIEKAPQAYKYTEIVALNYFTIPAILEKHSEEIEQVSAGESLRSYYLKELQRIK